MTKFYLCLVGMGPAEACTMNIFEVFAESLAWVVVAIMCAMVVANMVVIVGKYTRHNRLSDAILNWTSRFAWVLRLGGSAPTSHRRESRREEEWQHPIL